jgi:serine/threonine protein kinase
VLHQIGVGALGPVFRTYEPNRDRLVAVKVFRLDITPEQAQSLADELSKAADAGLFHPSIVEPLAAGVQGTVAYRAEEYVAAESLDVAMRHYAPATLDKVLPFITQLAGAIDFARAAGLGHGALHPRDIFVTPDEARATGFGVVDALERVSLRAPVWRPYSAPERIAGETWGTPADVFSLAAIAFELLTGRRPSGTGSQIGSLTGAPSSDQAARLHGVLARAMHEDPAARFPTALAFAGALESGSVEAIAPPSEPADVRPRQFELVTSKPPEPLPAPKATTPPAAAEIPPPVVAQPPAMIAPPPDADDIAAERDEDEAHWALSQAEARQQNEIEAEEPRTLFNDEQVEASADNLAFDAADLALREEPERHVPLERAFADEFVRKPAPEEEIPAPPPPARERPFAPIVVPPAGSSQPSSSRLLVEEPVEPEPRQSSRAMLPSAVTLIFGLLIGFIAAYALLSRGSGRQTAATTAPAPSTQTAQSPPVSTPTPPTREFSEGTVTPSKPAAPSPDVPQERAGSGRAESTSPPPPGAGQPRGRETAAPTARGPDSTRPAPRQGRIVVRSTPTGASVTVNGEWRGRTPLTLEELTFGDYVVRIVAPGYEIAREEFKLSSAQTSRTISRRLVRSAPAARGNTAADRPARTSAPPPRPPGARFTGAIFIDSRPRGAKVFVDGKEVGTTPVKVPEVGVGAHVVRLELADHRTWTNGIRVTAGEETRVTGSLEPVR